MKYAVALASLFLLLHSARADDSMPVFHKDDVILFQGDSITDGGRQGGNDYNHTMGQDYDYIISAQIGCQFPDRNLTFVNRGNSGNKVTDLAGRWQNDTLNLKPTFLSILVGINDASDSSSTPESYEATYDKLISDTIAALPNVRIVLGEPFVLPVGSKKNNYETFRERLDKYQEVVARLADKYHLPIIHYQKAFDEACQLAPADHWSWDGIHPTYAGHGLMVREWLRVVNEFWPNG
jgi:lysophospholipase L1-like esterase